MTSTPGANHSASGRILDGKVALVIGASRGIGAETARAFAAAGAKVAVAARDEAALNCVVESIVGAGGDALAIPTDIGDAAAVEHLVDETVRRYGRLDIALNNAARTVRPAPLADVAMSDFEETVRVNLLGFFVAMKHEIPAMLASGGGAIVNMGSTAAVGAWYGIGPYVATKHALVGLSKTAALDYAANGIRVNVVAPGPVATDRIQSLSDEQRAPIKAAVPMQRIGTVQDVASRVVWLCSDQASFITGTVVPIDGGQLARI